MCQPLLPPGGLPHQFRMFTAVLPFKVNWFTATNIRTCWTKMFRGSYRFLHPKLGRFQLEKFIKWRCHPHQNLRSHDPVHFLWREKWILLFTFCNFQLFSAKKSWCRPCIGTLLCPGKSILSSATAEAIIELNPLDYIMKMNVKKSTVKSSHCKSLIR